MNEKNQNAEKVQDTELTAREIKEKLPLMLQHVINFYETTLPKEFSGDERLKTIKILDWAWQIYNGRDVMAEENVRDGILYNDEICRSMPQIIKWAKVLTTIEDMDSLSDKNITKPALYQSRLLHQPLAIDGREMLEPREYFIDQFLKTCKGHGIH